MSLRALLAGSAPVVTSELVPPRGADAEDVRRQVRELGWADALNVTDLPQAKVRMSSLAACAIAAQAGARPILQMTCRDRNRLALAADAIGAAALGVDAVLPLYGDPVGPDSPAAESRDLDTPELVALLRELGEGRTPDGLDVEPPARLLVGAAASPGRTTTEQLAAKVDAGASFVQTQIVLDAEAFAEWLRPVHAAGLTERAALLVGIASPRSATFAERVAGFGALVAPDVGGRAEAGDGLGVAREIVERVLALPGVRGLHLMPLGSSQDDLAALAGHARDVVPAG